MNRNSNIENRKCIFRFSRTNVIPEVRGDLLYARFRFQARQAGIAIEQSRGAVIHALMYDFLVLYPINS